MHYILKLIILLIAIFLHPESHATTSVKAQLTKHDIQTWLDGWLEKEISYGDLAGIVVTVVKGNESVFTQGYGYSDISLGSKITDAHLVRPGSISKLFTFTAVMQMVESGELELDEDIRELLDFDLNLNFDNPITLRHLMTHRAGFENVIRDLIVTDSRLISNEEWLKQNVPEQIFPPGETAAYSNYGAALAGYVVELKTGIPFEDFIETSLFLPLEFKGASFKNELPAASKELIVQSYNRASEPPKPFEKVPPSPSGALSISAKDMGKFMLMHLNKGNWKGRVIIKPETIDLMHNSLTENIPGLPSMALGFYRADRNKQLVLAHSGDTMHHHSGMLLFPESKVGIFINIVGSGKNDAAYQLRRAVLDAFTDRYFPCDSECDSRYVLPNSEQTLVRARQVAGNYLSSRKSSSTLLNISNYFQQQNIKALPYGVLETPFYKMPSGESWKWKEISPYVWQQLDGKEKLAAVVTPDGDIVKVSLSHIAPFASLLPVKPMQNATIHLFMLYLAVAVLMGALANTVFDKYVFWRHSIKENKSKEYTYSRIACALTITSLIAWLWVFTLMSLMSLGAAWIRLAQLLTLVSASSIIFTFKYAYIQINTFTSLATKFRAVLLVISHAYISVLPFIAGMMSLMPKY